MTPSVVGVSPFNNINLSQKHFFLSAELSKYASGIGQFYLEWLFENSLKPIFAIAPAASKMLQTLKLTQIL